MTHPFNALHIHHVILLLLQSDHSPSLFPSLALFKSRKLIGAMVPIKIESKHKQYELCTAYHKIKSADIIFFLD